MIRDSEFIRGNTPMTKEKTRALSFFELDIKEGDKFLDIGSGTGSISAQALALGASVIAIDKSEEAVKLTKSNCKNFGNDFEVILGSAPNDLPNTKFNKVFVGGASKKITDIFEYLEENLIKDGILCANFILVSSLSEFLEELKKRNYYDIRATLSQVSNMSSNGLFLGENPIYIVSARRG